MSVCITHAWLYRHWILCNTTHKLRGLPFPATGIWLNSTTYRAQLSKHPAYHQRTASAYRYCGCEPVIAPAWSSSSRDPESTAHALRTAYRQHTACGGEGQKGQGWHGFMRFEGTPGAGQLLRGNRGGWVCDASC